jgi:hypothetical protein
MGRGGGEGSAGEPTLSRRRILQFDSVVKEMAAETYAEVSARLAGTFAELAEVWRDLAKIKFV